GKDLRLALEGIAAPDDSFESEIEAAVAALTVEDRDPWRDA
ncbi:MAG TPA: prevent-host-death protein, partial [Intrasporangiaceae bacterium]|nr:prevent-host-death protein [Intrasporangiaceae bacterium]